MMKQLSFALVLAVACVACKREETLLHSAPEPKLEQGWVKTPSSDNSVSINIPPGWGVPKQLDMAYAPSMSDANNKAQRTMEMSGFGGGEKAAPILTITDGRRALPGEVATGFTIRKEKKNMTLKAAAADAAVGQVGMGDVKFIELPIGQAAEYKYTYTTIGGDSISKDIFILAHKDTVYTVTFSEMGTGGTIYTNSQPCMQTLRIAGLDEKAAK